MTISLSDVIYTRITGTWHGKKVTYTTDYDRETALEVFSSLYPGAKVKKCILIKQYNYTAEQQSKVDFAIIDPENEDDNGTKN